MVGFVNQVLEHWIGNRHQIMLDDGRLEGLGHDTFQGLGAQSVTDFLLDQLLLVASLLSSEAFTGIETIRDEIKGLGEQSEAEHTEKLRAAYDRRVEKLGRLFFALGRRLHQLESVMKNCPLTGSAEQLRGRYGQRVRDLAGDVRFMRQELSRWVHRFVPLRGDTRADAQLLEGRLDAVVDELGLRVREVQETLNATVFEQLVLIEPSLTRKQLFRRDPENVVDVGRLLDWSSNVLDWAKEFDEGRRADQLERVKTLLREFDAKQFLSFAVLRESDQAMLLKSIDDVNAFELEAVRPREEDPIKLFILLMGNFISGLRRVYRDPTDTGGGG